MTTAVLIGCGGKNAQEIVRACSGRFDKIYNIGSTPSLEEKVTNLQIDWHTFHLNELHQICKEISEVDFIFFNQNGSSLRKDVFDVPQGAVETINVVKSWTQTHWISCQMPFAMIQNLRKKFSADVKIGWMLSGFIDFRKQDVHMHADYSANKFTNYLVMKCFSDRYYCFGIDPDFDAGNITDFLNNIFQNKENYNGKIFGID